MDLGPAHMGLDNNRGIEKQPGSGNVNYDWIKQCNL